jgi:hypothetical protein
MRPPYNSLPDFRPFVSLVANEISLVGLTADYADDPDMEEKKNLSFAPIRVIRVIRG